MQTVAFGEYLLTARLCELALYLRVLLSIHVCADTLCALVVLYYDFLLTFPFEVERYWAGGRSWASCCFFANRYMAVLGHLPVVYEFFGTMPEEVRRSCGHL